MQKNGALLNEPDLREFDLNRSKYPPAQLNVYVGMHVAWSPDGRRILAFGPTREYVDNQLESVGIHFSQVVHDYIDPPVG